jgi:predicted Rossmann fold flavoprotein
MSKHHEVVIIGAGAAGLMCAYIAAQRGKKVLLLDHSHKLAEKIRISGGGRCNFTNLHTKPECYLSNNPRFCISPLSRYTPQHFTGLLDRYNIAYHEKTLGQLFCNNSANDIIKLLDFLTSENKVMRQMGVTINHLEKSQSGFELQTTLGKIRTETLVIASGGLSIPQIGATGFGYAVAKQFNLAVVPPTPALVPLTLSQEELKHFAPLAGVSFLSEVAINQTKFQENTLITHRGLSGPAILQISSYWHKADEIVINMLPHLNLLNLLETNRSSTKLLSNFLSQFFPERLADNICLLLQLNKPLSQLSKKEITRIGNFIHHFSLIPSGNLGYKKAEVTKGGVDTTGLSSKTMMAQDVEGLYFIGEVVDVTGWLGGYNFQWAWSSAYAAGSTL